MDLVHIVFRKSTIVQWFFIHFPCSFRSWVWQRKHLTNRLLSGVNYGWSNSKFLKKGKLWEASSVTLLGAVTTSDGNDLSIILRADQILWRYSWNMLESLSKMRATEQHASVSATWPLPLSNINGDESDGDGESCRLLVGWWSPCPRAKPPAQKNSATIFATKFYHNFFSKHHR